MPRTPDVKTSRNLAGLGALIGFFAALFVGPNMKRAATVAPQDHNQPFTIHLAKPEHTPQFHEAELAKLHAASVPQEKLRAFLGLMISEGSLVRDTDKARFEFFSKPGIMSWLFSWIGYDLNRAVYESAYEFPNYCFVHYLGHGYTEPGRQWALRVQAWMLQERLPGVFYSGSVLTNWIRDGWDSQDTGDSASNPQAMSGRIKSAMNALGDWVRLDTVEEFSQGKPVYVEPKRQ